MGEEPPRKFNHGAILQEDPVIAWKYFIVVWGAGTVDFDIDESGQKVFENLKKGGVDPLGNTLATRALLIAGKTKARTQIIEAGVSLNRLQAKGRKKACRSDLARLALLPTGLLGEELQIMLVNLKTVEEVIKNLRRNSWNVIHKSAYGS